MPDLRTDLVNRIEKLGVEHRRLPGRDDGFAALSYNGKEFAHFHNDHELDIHLTKPTIDREGLVHPPRSVVHPNRTNKSHWIEVRFTTAEEVDHVVRLVKIAIGEI